MTSPVAPSINRRALLIGASAVAAVGIGGPASAAEPVWTNFWGLAIRGYDPVAYFSDGKPVEGLKAHEIEWMGASWRFATAENKNKFLADPEAFAPQYGGYCAWAVANGYTASTVPEAWEIVDGKLYLNYSLGVRETWRQDIPGNIRKGDAKWPGLREG
ncbi:MAG: YHS domain-containing (seleno)protein [Pseudomonadota bacterium]